VLAANPSTPRRAMQAIAHIDVIPAKAGIHEHGPIEIPRGGVHGSRVKPGMTGRTILTAQPCRAD
jgi:hypothetical protein